MDLVLSPDNETPFFELVFGLTYSSGTARKSAESHFRFLAFHHTTKTSTKLLSVIRSTAQSDVRVTAIRYLRSIILHTPQWHLWIRIEPPIQHQIKMSLLHLVIKEETRSVLEQLQRAVIDVGSVLLPKNSWPEILYFIFPQMSDDLPRVRESVLIIFSQLARFMRRSWLPPVNTLRDTIHFSLSDLTIGEEVQYVRTAALLAAFGLIDLVPPSKNGENIQCLLPCMVDVLQEAFTYNQQEVVKRAVRSLTCLINTELQFICWYLPEIVGIMLDIAKSENVQQELRLNAVNLVITFAKTREKEPVMVEQVLVPVLGPIVAILLEMLSDMEDDEAWYTADSHHEENNINYAEKLSNSLSAALGGGLLIPVLIDLLPAHLADSDWKKRHAALFFLKEIAKGCAEAMKENLEQYVNMMVDSFKDNHSRVQGAALIAMRVLLVDLKPDLVSQYHDKIFLALLEQAENTFNCPRIQVEAARSAWIFMHSCSKNILKIYLRDISHMLVHMMILKENRAVQDEALLILESLPYLLEDELESFYKDSMFMLKFFLKDVILCADRMFCAKLMKCISTVGTVLGKDHFRNDAKEVMQELMSLKGAKMEADDPATGYLLKVWMELLKCLGRDFLPYMELVMPPLLQSAQSDSELIVSSTNMDNTEFKTGKSAGDKLLDEKASACNMFCSYADELKEDFYPWIHQVAPLLLPFLKIKFHKKVRKAAISAMSKLLCSAKLAVEKGIISDGPEAPCVGFKRLCASLIDAMHEEDDKELCEMVKPLVAYIQLARDQFLIEESTA